MWVGVPNWVFDLSEIKPSFALRKGTVSGETEVLRGLVERIYVGEVFLSLSLCQEKPHHWTTRILVPKRQLSEGLEAEFHLLI